MKTEAIAGTRTRGNTPIDDERIALSLMRSDKDLREHGFVVKALQESLDPITEELSGGENVSVLRLARSQHLMASMAGTLREDVSDAKLFEDLHPTPAVGSYPKACAYREINRYEDFDRGWYAGPVGWVSRHEVELIVAIRSALVHDNTLSLYAGAGIVEGSDAEAEWDEVEHKIGDFIKILTDKL